MPLTRHRSPTPVCSEGAQLFVDIEWKDAPSLQSHFRRHGVRTIAEYDAIDRVARLQVLDVGPDRTHAVLRHWHA